MVAWQEQPSGLRCLGEPGLKFFNFPCAALTFLVGILSLYSPRSGARWSYKRTGAPQKPKRQILLKYMPPKQTEWHLFKSSALILFLTEMSWLFSILSAHLMLPTFGQVSAAAFESCCSSASTSRVLRWDSCSRSLWCLEVAKANVEKKLRNHLWWELLHAMNWIEFDKRKG